MYRFFAPIIALSLALVACGGGKDNTSTWDVLDRGHLNQAVASYYCSGDTTGACADDNSALSKTIDCVIANVMREFKAQDVNQSVQLGEEQGAGLGQVFVSGFIESAAPKCAKFTRLAGITPLVKQTAQPD